MAVHGDDFVSEGAREDLKWFDEALAKEFEIKTEDLTRVRSRSSGF